MFQNSLFNQLPEKIDFNLPDADVVLYNNFFSANESNLLFNSLKTSVKWQQDKIKFYGKEFMIPRLTALYGDEDKRYSYSGIHMHPHQWTHDLNCIKNKIETIANVKFTTCLLNYYRNGNDSMNWHQDNENELGKNPIIASVTFGETRTFQLKHITKTNLKRVDIPLQHGSFLLMQGSTQHFWKHKIPKTKKQISSRINLTFRVIKNQN